MRQYFCKKKYIVISKSLFFFCCFFHTAKSGFTGTLAGDVTGKQKNTKVKFVNGVSHLNVSAGANAANAATSSNTANTIVKRDGSGNFSAGTITAALSGNATTATTATNFSGSLAGDVTGPQGTTAVANVGGVTAANVASGANAANAATDANTASTIVKRNASGNFTAGTITAALSGNATTATTATNFSGSLSGDVSGTQSATVVDSVGGEDASDIATGVKAANAATDANTVSTIVMRDESGDFAAGTVTLTALVTDSISPSGTEVTVDSDLIVNGSVTANGFNDLSDRRIKMDIIKLDHDFCLAVVNQIDPQEFTYVPEVRKAINDDGSRHVGFIAQDLAAIDSRFVAVVAGAKQLGDLTIDDLVLVKKELFVPLLVGALKAEDKKILSKAEVSDVQKLQDRVDALEKLIGSKIF